MDYQGAKTQNLCKVTLRNLIGLALGFARAQSSKKMLPTSQGLRRARVFARLLCLYPIAVEMKKSAKLQG